MRVKCGLLIMVCFVLVLNASAQEVLTIHGVVSKKLSMERVPQVLIRDLKTNELMMSDELGWFTIKASVGDTLLFSKQDYTDQKIVIINNSDIPVYMQPVIKLATVTVKGQTTKQELNDVMADYRKKGTFYDGKPPALSFISNPLTGLYELFGKGPNQAKRFAAYSKGEQEYAEVRRRYTISLVKRVTNTTDSAAKKFMEYYTPSYQDLKLWNDYDLMKEVKKSYDYYVENRERLNLDQMNSSGLIQQVPSATDNK